MTTEDSVNSLKMAVQQVAERAKSEPELGERMLTDPAKTIATATGYALPSGWLVKAERTQDGDVEISLAADPHHTEEIADASLDAVTGGATAIQYGLIAATISIAIIGTAQSLGGQLSSKLSLK